MDRLDLFFQNNALHNPDDIDALLELASLQRDLISLRQYSALQRILCYTVEHGYYEAFGWTLSILQEELARPDCTLENFECPLGGSIPDYNEFIQRLQVDLNCSKNDAIAVRDENGEVQSFFNILTYRTGYENILLVSSENFDTKDNDYILYKLLFTRTPDQTRTDL